MTAPTTYEGFGAIDAPMLALHDQVTAMLEFALDHGYSVTAGLVDQVAASSSAPSREVRAGMVAAHRELARLVHPATPRGIATLRAERREGFVQLIGPVRLVRFLMLVTLIALAVFVGLFVATDAPDDINAATAITEDAGSAEAEAAEEQLSGETTADTPAAEAARNITAAYFLGDWYDVLARVLYLLSAALLGASFGQLYRVNRYIATANYDRQFESSYTANLVLGAVAGIMLAILIPVGSIGGLEASVTKPLLALLGGFSARAVHRILSRIVDSIETLVKGDPREEASTAAMAAEVRIVNEVAQDRAALAVGLTEARQALEADDTATAKEKLDSQVAQVVSQGPATAMAIPTVTVSPAVPEAADPLSEFAALIEGPDPIDLPTSVDGGPPSDGVNDARSADELAAPDSGEPWGDPTDGGLALIPGRDFDPTEDPDYDPDDQGGS